MLLKFKFQVVVDDLVVVSTNSFSTAVAVMLAVEDAELVCVE